MGKIASAQANGLDIFLSPRERVLFAPATKLCRLLISPRQKE